MRTRSNVILLALLPRMPYPSIVTPSWIFVDDYHNISALVQTYRSIFDFSGFHLWDIWHWCFSSVWHAFQNVRVGPSIFCKILIHCSVIRYTRFRIVTFSVSVIWSACLADRHHIENRSIYLELQHGVRSSTWASKCCRVRCCYSEGCGIQTSWPVNVM